MNKLPNKGDVIRLNDKAREWTHDKVFTIDEVKHWGVICYWNTDPGVSPPGTAFYRATWDQIEEVK